MADTKITALAAIGLNPINVATFPIPMVDLLDNSMAASGTTKKVTVNQILGAGGTATLASATITGDLTVDTSTLKVDSANDRVGIGTATPAAKLIVRDGANRNLLVASDATQLGSSGIAIGGFTDGAAGYAPLSIISSSTQFGISGSTAMTLNANGLGIGATPSAWGNNWKANHVGTVGSFASSGAGSAPPTAMVIGAYNDNTNWKYQFSSTGAARYEMTGANAGSVHAWYTAPGGTVNNNITFTQAMTLDADGDLGVGITNPSHRLHALVSSGADRDIFAAQVLSASNGLQVKWNHATTTLRVILANIPTSSAGLAAGTLWNDAGTIKIA